MAELWCAEFIDRDGRTLYRDFFDSMEEANAFADMQPAAYAPFIWNLFEGL